MVCRDFSIFVMIFFLCSFMAKREDIIGAMDSLGDSFGPIDLKNEFIKKFVIKKKILAAYGISEEVYEMNPKEIDEMIENIIKERTGDLVLRLETDLGLIQTSLNSVIKQAPVLLGQMATIPIVLIATTAAGPTVPNPLQIKYTLEQIKATASSMSAELSIALGKVIEYGLEDFIPDVVISTANVLTTIKDFPIDLPI